MNTKDFIGLNPEIDKESVLIYKDRRYSAPMIYEAVTSMETKLRDLGITAHQRVGIMLGNSPLFICALLGVARLQASAVLFSTHFKKFELESYITDSAIGLMVGNKNAGQILEKISQDTTLANSEESGISENDVWGQAAFWRIQQPEEAYIDIPEEWHKKEFTLQFTSGTGGKSKIVPRSYEAVFNELESYARATGLNSNDLVICPAPFFHAYGLINGFLAPFYKGATVCLSERFIPNNAIKQVRRFKPTIFIGVPFMYDLLCQTFLAKEVDFSSIRIAFSAGAKLGREVFDNFRKRFGIRIKQQYGSTETGTMALCRDHFEDFDSVGQPLPGRCFDIVDEQNQSLAPGEEGEIIIKSPGNTEGYSNRPDFNLEKFREGWYYTGDIGHLDKAGNLFITGRKSFFINVAGLKVDPFEVEQTLLSMPVIKECAVVAKLADAKHSEIIKAYIVANDNEVIDINLIGKYCKDRLADYKVPKEIESVEELPRSPTGKILMKYLV
ncbi:MAG: acyl--CoA ligase [bacterium]|nr:acyl--CoA ligase [bacterium]